MLLFTCERDDICPETTATTPSLIIRFYDIENPTETKSVNQLTIIGDGTNVPLLLTTSTDSIAIPLKTDSGLTSFTFFKDSNLDANNQLTGNPDVINFEYAPYEVYVSRACGFKTNYQDLEASLVTDSDNWMLSIPIQEPITVDNETAAHIQIFH